MMIIHRCDGTRSYAWTYAIVTYATVTHAIVTHVIVTYAIMQCPSLCLGLVNQLQWGTHINDMLRLHVTCICREALIAAGHGTSIDFAAIFLALIGFFDNGARGILVNVLLGAIFGLANHVEVASPDIW